LLQSGVANIVTALARLYFSGVRWIIERLAMIIAALLGALCATGSAAAGLTAGAGMLAGNL